MEIILGILRPLAMVGKQVFDWLRLRMTLRPSAGRYWVSVKGTTERKLQVVTIEVKGDLLKIDMDLSKENRGHATATVPVDRRTREGQGSYTHVITDEEPLFGAWHLAIRNSDTIDVTTRYSRHGLPEEVQGHVWHKMPDQDDSSSSSIR
jgi:hypothetical protein